MKNTVGSNQPVTCQNVQTTPISLSWVKKEEVQMTHRYGATTPPWSSSPISLRRMWSRLNKLFFWCISSSLICKPYLPFWGLTLQIRIWCGKEFFSCSFSLSAQNAALACEGETSGKFHLHFSSVFTEMMEMVSFKHGHSWVIISMHLEITRVVSSITYCLKWTALGRELECLFWGWEKIWRLFLQCFFLSFSVLFFN